MDQFQKASEYQKKVSGYIKLLDFSKKKKIDITRKEFDLIKKSKEINSIYGGILVMLYSIILDGDNSVKYLFNSIIKQRSFNRIVQNTLLFVAIEKEDIRAFEYEIESFEKRIYKIKSVMDEIMQETKYYLYYKHIVGSDFMEIISTSTFKEDSILFISLAEKYNNENAKEYEESLLKMNELIALRNKFRDGKRQAIIEDKKIIKAEKKKENEEIKEMKLNKKKYNMEDRQLGKAGNSYYYSNILK